MIDIKNYSLAPEYKSLSDCMPAPPETRHSASCTTNQASLIYPRIKGTNSFNCMPAPSDVQHSACFYDYPSDMYVVNIMTKIVDNNYPIIVNVHTNNDPYIGYAKKLLDSINRFNLSYYIVIIDKNLKTWSEVCQLKPIVLLKAMDKYPTKNIVWLDADAIIEQLPTLFLKIDKDIGAHYINKNMLTSGTIFFNNTDKSKQILHDWIKINNKHRNVYDQETLKTIINYRYKNNIYRLPGEYCAIFDNRKHKKLKKIISHWQASRKVKDKHKIPIGYNGKIIKVNFRLSSSDKILLDS